MSYLGGYTFICMLWICNLLFLRNGSCFSSSSDYLSSKGLILFSCISATIIWQYFINVPCRMNGNCLVPLIATQNIFVLGVPVSYWLSSSLFWRNVSQMTHGSNYQYA